MIQDLTWKTSAGGAIVFTGGVSSWSEGKQKGIKNGLIKGKAQVQGGAGCLDPDKAQVFTVNATFSVTEGAKVDPNEIPPLCKESGDPLCAYDTKG